MTAVFRSALCQSHAKQINSMEYKNQRKEQPWPKQSMHCRRMDSCQYRGLPEHEVNACRFPAARHHVLEGFSARGWASFPELLRTVTAWLFRATRAEVMEVDFRIGISFHERLVWARSILVSKESRCHSAFWCVCVCRVFGMVSLGFVFGLCLDGRLEVRYWSAFRQTSNIITWTNGKRQGFSEQLLNNTFEPPWEHISFSHQRESLSVTNVYEFLRQQCQRWSHSWRGKPLMDKAHCRLRAARLWTWPYEQKVVAHANR